MNFSPVGKFAEFAIPTAFCKLCKLLDLDTPSCQVEPFTPSIDLCLSIHSAFRQRTRAGLVSSDAFLTVLSGQNAMSPHLRKPEEPFVQICSNSPF